MKKIILAFSLVFAAVLCAAPKESQDSLRTADTSSSMTGLDSAHKAEFWLNPFGFSNEPNNGVQLGLFITFSQRAYVGTQVSVLGNFAIDDMQGTQVSALMNFSLKKFYGAQIAGAFNYASDFSGVQIALVNIAAKGKGVQVGSINLYANDLEGFQAGVINIGGKTSVGQGGVVNIAGDAGKAQGGVVNISGKTEYVQGGVVNIAGKVGNRQVGIINIAGHSEKTPIGIINIVGNGIFDVTLYGDETGGIGAALHTGTPYLYTLFEYNQGIGEDGIFEYPKSWGFGFGTRFGMKGSFLNLDYAFLNAYSKKPHNFNIGYDSDERDKGNFLNKIRFGGAWKFLPGVALTGGINLNVLMEGNDNGDNFVLEPKGEYHWHWTAGSHKARVWPGVYAGLTLGKF